MLLNTGCTVFRGATVTGEQYPALQQTGFGLANSVLQQQLLQCPICSTTLLQSGSLDVQ
jgi:hypothetical protein